MPTPDKTDILAERTPNDTAGEIKYSLPEENGYTGGTQEKKRPVAEDAQKRSDTGTGL